MFLYMHFISFWFHFFFLKKIKTCVWLWPFFTIQPLDHPQDKQVPQSQIALQVKEAQTDHPRNALHHCLCALHIALGSWERQAPWVDTSHVLWAQTRHPNPMECPLPQWVWVSFQMREWCRGKDHVPLHGNWTQTRHRESRRLWTQGRGSGLDGLQYLDSCIGVKGANHFVWVDGFFLSMSIIFYLIKVFLRLFWVIKKWLESKMKEVSCSNQAFL